MKIENAGRCLADEIQMSITKYVKDNEYEMAYGFIRSGELRRIISNTDPLLVPKKV